MLRQGMESIPMGEMHHLKVPPSLGICRGHDLRALPRPGVHVERACLEQMYCNTAHTHACTHACTACLPCNAIIHCKHACMQSCMHMTPHTRVCMSLRTIGQPTFARRLRMPDGSSCGDAGHSTAAAAIAAATPRPSSRARRLSVMPCAAHVCRLWPSLQLRALAAAVRGGQTPPDLCAVFTCLAQGVGIGREMHYEHTCTRLYQVPTATPGAQAIRHDGCRCPRGSVRRWPLGLSLITSAAAPLSLGGWAQRASSKKKGLCCYPTARLAGPRA
eukprot:357270-Chlamydomonas_euryale.AAC.3